MGDAKGERLVPVGRIAGVYGVRGWVRVFSETTPRENILRYSPWLVGGQRYRVEEGRRHGKGIVAKLTGCDDRDQAASLIGETVAVRRDQLPPPGADELYWVDLEGLKVETLDGAILGRVSRLFETGANDVMVVEGDRARLLPFVWERVVKEVDFGRGLVRVDWDPDF